MSRADHGKIPALLWGTMLIIATGEHGDRSTIPRGQARGGIRAKPVFLYNLLDLKRPTGEGPELGAGKHTIVFDFTTDGPGLGKGGMPVGEGTYMTIEKTGGVK